MKRTKSSVIPPSVVRRLTEYMAFTQAFGNENGDQWVSSQELAQALGFTSSTVRQDLSHIDFSGISKRGYHVKGLLGVLEDTLGANTVWQLVVVGAGNLGLAIAQNDDFRERGYNIIGVFDNDTAKVGRQIGALKVQHASSIKDFVTENRVDIGIVAVPAVAAQAVADVLIASGVRGILNLSLSHIITPGNVPVIEARLTCSLLELSHRIKFSKAAKRSVSRKKPFVCRTTNKGE